MATEVILPKLGMNTETATILSWQKQEGETVAVGDVLAEVETDKAVIELEAEAAGVLRRWLAAEGDQVAVNAAIALIGSASEDLTAIEQKLSRATPATVTHVEHIYQTWKAPDQAIAPPTNGHHSGNGSVASADRKPTPEPRLDPNAIRARLAKRGILGDGPATEVSRTRLVIYGSGLGAKQLLEVTRLLEDVEVVGLIDDNPDLLGVTLGGARVLGGFSALAELAARHEIDGVALSFHSEVRKKVHERIRAELDIRILPLVDPRAVVGMDVTIADGALIEAGAVIGPGTVVGEGTIVDVGVTVAHDCLLGPFSHLSPGCALSGVVCLKGNVLVGVGAALNSTITVGRGVIITPGSAVMNDVPDNVVVSGVPARNIGASRRDRAGQGEPDGA
ncbi:MAG TPA: biotin/lipoyl-containing protein [Thermomicrobiales bacterium]|nr:biotin/lipoyl-containing protein [Thermomicrobiales bacterium]